jgi:hypothetical protein
MTKNKAQEIKLKKTRNRSIYRLEIDGVVIAHIRLYNDKFSGGANAITVQGFGCSLANVSLGITNREYVKISMQKSNQGDWTEFPKELGE